MLFFVEERGYMNVLKFWTYEYIWMYSSFKQLCIVLCNYVMWQVLNNLRLNLNLAFEMTFALTTCYWSARTANSELTQLDGRGNKKANLVWQA